jgi:hypothetical protein
MLGNMFGTLDKYVAVSMCGCACFYVLCVMNLELFWNIGARKGASRMEHPFVWLCVMNLEHYSMRQQLCHCVFLNMCARVNCDVCISEQKKYGPQLQCACVNV